MLIDIARRIRSLLWFRTAFHSDLFTNDEKNSESASAVRPHFFRARVSIINPTKESSQLSVRHNAIIIILKKIIIFKKIDSIRYFW